MRFPYIDGTGVHYGQQDNASNWYCLRAPANTIYSAQRLQPYRGGHAVPPPYITGTGTTTTPPDPRYGYTEQICLPQSPMTALQTYGILSRAGSAQLSGDELHQYHTLGQPNNSAENWDYLVFNDRDFTSVAELMLVPGCPPGLFTKQFVEFAPSQINAANIFATVTPIITPTFPTSSVTLVGRNPWRTHRLRRSGYAPSPRRPCPSSRSRRPARPLSPRESSTRSCTPDGGTGFPDGDHPGLRGPDDHVRVPTISPSTTQPSRSTIPSPVQPHSFPYLVDKFFYTGASTFYYPPTGGATDPSASSNHVVGGPAADGWFKMFDFFEVPSQTNGVDRAGRPGDQLRLGPAGYQAGAHERQPDHRRGGVLRRLRPAEHDVSFTPDAARRHPAPALAQRALLAAV